MRLGPPADDMGLHSGHARIPCVMFRDDLDSCCRRYVDHLISRGLNGKQIEKKVRRFKKAIKMS